MAKNERGKAPTDTPSLQPLPVTSGTTPEFEAYAVREGIDAEPQRRYDAWNAWKAALQQPALPGVSGATQVQVSGPDTPLSQEKLDGISLVQHRELVQATRGLLVALQRTGTLQHRMRLVGEAGDRVVEALKALGHNPMGDD